MVLPVVMLHVEQCVHGDLLVNCQTMSQPSFFEKVSQRFFGGLCTPNDV